MSQHDTPEPPGFDQWLDAMATDLGLNPQPKGRPYQGPSPLHRVTDERDQARTRVRELETQLASAKAAGYRQAADHVAEMIQTHGPDFDQQMILVFLQNGAEIREQFAANQQPGPSGPTRPAYWLAEYEGAEPTLWTTEADALAHCASLARGEGIRSWDWTTEDGAHQMIHVRPDTDGPLSRGPGRVTELHPQTADQSPTRPA
ncbi:hypothetical protein [Kitasatospora sp. NPDC005856]|uniref:hypothetical protein n=1 Tax=Kitasatospora sp. NPDC005856 TaxID=3154566 RepID=UPI0033D1B3BF